MADGERRRVRLFGQPQWAEAYALRDYLQRSVVAFDWVEIAYDNVATCARSWVPPTHLHDPRSEMFVRVLQEHRSGYRLVTLSGCGGLYGKFEFNNVPPGEYRILESKGNAELPYLEPSYFASRAEFVAIVRVADGQTSKGEVTPVRDHSDPGR